MNSFDKKDCVNRYNQRLSDFGYDPRSLGWGGGKARQETRFKSLMGIGAFIPQGVNSVLDVGCGFGDLFNYLRKESTFSEAHYLGVDINSELLNVAKEQTDDKINVKCFDILSVPLNECSDFLSGPYDVVIESGIFNYRLVHQNHMEYVDEMLRRMFSLARYGVAADFMTSHVDWMAEGSFHMSPTELFDLAYAITPRVVIRHDYLPYEFCVYLLRE